MRQLIVGKNQDKKGLVTIEGKDFHYLRQVLRVKAGDMVKLRFPEGSLQNSTVCKIDDSSKTITLQVCATQDVIARSEATKQSTNEIAFSLFQFIPKPQKLELIVRQATECGVKNIIPVISEYAQKGNVQALTGGKKERLERIVREARQQSGSPVDTVVFDPVTLEEAIEIWNKMKEEAGGPEASAGFVLSERAVPEPVEGQSKVGASTSSTTPRAVAIFCGNEGGISPDELQLITDKALLQALHFSVNILRCETAALYGIAAIQTSIYGI